MASPCHRSPDRCQRGLGRGRQVVGVVEREMPGGEGPLGREAWCARPPRDRGPRSARGRLPSRRPPSACHGSSRGGRRAGYRSRGGSPTPVRTVGGAHARPATGSSPEPGVPLDGVAGRGAGRGWPRASEGAAPAHRRRGPGARPGSTPGTAGGAGAGRRGPAGGDARRVGPGSGPRARGLGVSRPRDRGRSRALA